MSPFNFVSTRRIPVAVSLFGELEPAAFVCCAGIFRPVSKKFGAGI